MKLKKSLAALLAATIAVSPAVADEGMWLLPFLKQQNSEQLKKAGLIFESREKNYIYYSLNASVLEEVLLWLQDLKGEGKK